MSGGTGSACSLAGGDRLDAQGTMSREGGPWENDLQLTYERIDS